MGTEYSVHNDYELEESIPSSDKTWEMFSGQKKQSKAKVTVFVHEKNKQEKKKKSKSSNQKYLKVLRHPAILKYHASYEDSNEIYLITEPVVPLEMVLETLDVNEIIAGLFSIVQALDFLHEKCSLSHNDVSLFSVYVSTIDASWKLGRMEHVCKYSEVTCQFLESTKETRDSKSISPEEKESKVQLTEETGHSLDSYAFGILVGDILDCRTDLGKDGEKFGEKIQSLFLHIDPKMRPKFSSLYDDEFFSNPFLEVLTFLNNITVKSDIEKEKFFSTLVFKLKSFPPELVAKRLLLRLLSRFVLAEPSAIRDFLPHVLTPLPDSNELNEKLKGLNPILPENIFKESGVAILLKLFSVKDTHVRLLLLEFFGLFVRSFEHEDLKDFILPQLLLGLRDTDDTVVAATLQALSLLVPVLGGATVVGGEREKIFFEGRPKFSATTTISQDVPIKNLTHDESWKLNNGPSRRSLSPETVSDVIDLEKRLSPTGEKPVPPNKEKKQLEKEKRRKDIERKREERKKERDLQRLEREKRNQTLVEKNESWEIGTTSENKTRESDNDSEAWVDFDDTGSLNLPPNTGDHSRFDVADLDFTQTHERDEQSSLHKEKTRFLDQHGLFSAKSGKENNLGPSITPLPSSDKHTVPCENPSRDSNSDMSNISSQPEPRRSGKALKLGTKKTSKATDKASKRGVGALGSEFAIPVVSVQSSAPDFFADMEPNIDFRTHDAPGHRRSGFNNKLAVVDETSQVESGWDDESWEDFN